jgi:hypothetical protein
MLLAKRRTGSVKRVGGSDLRGKASPEGWQALLLQAIDQCERKLRSRELLSWWAILSSLPLLGQRRLKNSLRGLYSSFDAGREAKV